MPETILQKLTVASSTTGEAKSEAGPLIEDIYGQTMSAAYVGSFVILSPEISGHVLDSSGLPVRFVTLHPDGGLLPAVTDSHGSYALEVPPSWTGTITPSKGSALLVPSSRSYTNVTSDLTNQDFVLVKPAALTLSTQQQGDQLVLSWNGLAGVSYQLFWSSDMLNWVAYGASPLSGNNGPMSVSVSTGDQPAKFFRFLMTY